ncbi:MAG: hypothetical protein WD059_04785 [Balneolaceae bacterium]
MNKILITGVGGPTPIGIAKSLKLGYDDVSLIGIDADIYAPGLYRDKLFKKTYRVPKASDENYWEAIQEIVGKEKIDYAFVVPETEVLEWCRKEKEGLPCDALLPDAEIASFVYDKLNVSSSLASYQLTPKTIEIVDKNALDSIGNELDYPYWVREKAGAGAMGAFKIKEKKDIENWLKVNPGDVNLIASTFLPGRNFACKILYKNDELVMSATAERIEYLLSNAAPSGISGMCARGKLINHESLLEKSEKALKVIHEKFNKKIHGMFTVDFKEDKNGVPYITEINIRHVSFTYAFSLGGANFANKTLDVFHRNMHYKKGLFIFDKEYNFIRGVDTDLFIVDDSSLVD